MGNKSNLPKPKGGQHPHDANFAFPTGLDGKPQYYPDADDESIAHNFAIVNKTRLKMSVEDALQQGIIGEDGVDPRFTVVLPVRTMSPEKYLFVTNAWYTPAHRKIWVNLDIAEFEYSYVPIRLNPKARLHIIVN